MHTTLNKSSDVVRDGAGRFQNQKIFLQIHKRKLIYIALFPATKHITVESQLCFSAWLYMPSKVNTEKSKNLLPLLNQNNFQVFYSEDVGSMFLQNAGNHLLHYVAYIPGNLIFNTMKISNLIKPIIWSLNAGLWFEWVPSNAPSTAYRKHFSPCALISGHNSYRV
jgi:hypothetical protein